MRLCVFHQTKYRYPSPVKESFNEVRLKPISNEWQKCESCFVNVIPTAQLRQYLDLNGNLVHHFEIPQDHSKLIIERLAPRLPLNQELISKLFHMAKQ